MTGNPPAVIFSGISSKQHFPLRCPTYVLLTIFTDGVRQLCACVCIGNVFTDYCMIHALRAYGNSTKAPVYVRNALFSRTVHCVCCRPLPCVYSLLILPLLYTWYLVRFTLNPFTAVQQAERGAAEKAPHGGHRGEDFQQVLLSFLAEITRTVRGVRQ